MTDRATQLFEAGLYADALVLFQESADRYRAEATRDPAQFEVALATELNNVALCLYHLGRYDEAVGVLQEAARICEWYWQDDKGLSDFYAAVLASLAAGLGELRHYQQAMEISNHVVLLRRASSPPGSPDIDPDLARALRQFAEVRARAGVELTAIERAGVVSGPVLRLILRTAWARSHSARWPRTTSSIRRSVPPALEPRRALQLRVLPGLTRSDHGCRAAGGRCGALPVGRGDRQAYGGEAVPRGRAHRHARRGARRNRVPVFSARQLDQRRTTPR